MDPQEIKVVVYGARNLQPKKGDGVCNASVIFGIAKQKYRTEYIRDNDPTWNEETTIKVTKPAPLVFTVTDREDSLGTVSLPLAQIPSVAHRRRWMPLTTKSSQAMGDLCFDCWVHSFRKQSSQSSGGGSKWNNILLSGFKGGTGKDRQKRRMSIEGASISRRGSRSVENLYTLKELKPSDAPGISESRTKRKTSKISLKPTPSGGQISSSKSPANSPPGSAISLLPAFKPRLAPTLGQVLSSSKSPEITGLSPRSGPASGGTRITVRGCNLGTSKEDVISLSVCGCDLNPSLEYHSPAKLVVITKPWNGTGPVVLVTKSGGRGTSTVTFNFKDSHEGSTVPTVNTGHRKSTTNKVSRAELLTEITRLRGEVVDLNAENRSMKNYIERLMLVLMEKFPAVLDNLGASV